LTVISNANVGGNLVVSNNISCSTNTAQWYTASTSTTTTITNGASNGKALWTIQVISTMSSTGIPGILIQRPGLLTNYVYFPSGLTGTMTNTAGPFPVQPGYTNTWVDAPLGSGASDAAYSSQITP
jgi:hypothetical protein